MCDPIDKIIKQFIKLQRIFNRGSHWQQLINSQRFRESILVQLNERCCSNLYGIQRICHSKWHVLVHIRAYWLKNVKYKKTQLYISHSSWKTLCCNYDIFFNNYKFNWNDQTVWFTRFVRNNNMLLLQKIVLKYKIKGFIFVERNFQNKQHILFRINFIWLDYVRELFDITNNWSRTCHQGNSL